MSHPNTPNSDPFEPSRQAGPVAACDFQGESIPMLLRHKDIREAARNWKTFSSDAPFRVPIPSEESVRPVRQLPIETDPPDHTEYRRLIEPFFNRPREEWMHAAVRTLVGDMLAAALAAETVEAVTEFALPLQSRALAILLGVPLSEADEWISWGVNVFKEQDGPALNQEKGSRLNRYIQCRLDLAQRAPGEDFFSALTQAEFRGRPLTREEMTGFCNLVFAGGRDTIIHSISSILAHLADQPGILNQLRNDGKLVVSATEEFMRYLSPITHLGRVCPEGADLHGTRVAPGQRVSLCWASANRDAAVFDAPEELRLARKPNPHIAFGSGAHTCVGALHSRTLIRILLQVLSEKVAQIVVLDRQDHVEPLAQFARQIGYQRLVVKLTPIRCAQPES